MGVNVMVEILIGILMILILAFEEKRIPVFGHIEHEGAVHPSI